MQQAVGHVEVAVVVGDHDQGAALSPKLWQQLGIEDAAELGILIGSPFVEHQHRALLQPGLNQRQAFALASGKVGGRVVVVIQADLVSDLQTFQVAVGFGRYVLAALEQILEQEVVGEDGGEQLTVVVTIDVRHRLAVEQQCAAFGRVEAQ